MQDILVGSTYSRTIPDLVRGPGIITSDAWMGTYGGGTAGATVKMSWL